MHFWSHDPSEIILICWFAAQQTFIIISNIENSWFLSNKILLTPDIWRVVYIYV